MVSAVKQNGSAAHGDAGGYGAESGHVQADGSAPGAGKNLVGIIYPPQEIRNIIDKTANFVARNGRQFEERIRENEKSNPRFCFLNPVDPYHAYYQHKIEQINESQGMCIYMPLPHGNIEKQI